MNSNVLFTSGSSIRLDKTSWQCSIYINIYICMIKFVLSTYIAN